MKNTSSINSLAFEISKQELEGQSGAGWGTALKMTRAGRCGYTFTISYECSSNHVSCG